MSRRESVSENRNITLVFQTYETRQSKFNKLNYILQENIVGVIPDHIYIHCEIAIGDNIYGSTKDRNIFSLDGISWENQNELNSRFEKRKLSEQYGNNINITPTNKQNRYYDVTKTDFFAIPKYLITPEKFTKISELAESLIGRPYGFMSAYSSALQAIPCCFIPPFLRASSFSTELLEKASCSQLVAWLLHHSDIFKFELSYDKGSYYLGSDFSLLTTSKLYSIMKNQNALIATNTPGFTKNTTRTYDKF